MKFQVTPRGADPAIKIKFERNLPGGWSIERESMGKEVWYIDFKVVCWWSQNGIRLQSRLVQIRGIPSRRVRPLASG